MLTCQDKLSPVRKVFSNPTHVFGFSLCKWKLLVKKHCQHTTLIHLLHEQHSNTFIILFKQKCGNCCLLNTDAVSNHSDAHIERSKLTLYVGEVCFMQVSVGPQFCGRNLSSRLCA